MATQLSAPGQTRTMRPRPLQHNTRQARRCPRIRERRRTGRESIQFSRCAKPNESPQRAGRRLSRGQERMFRRSTRRRSRDSAVVAAERTWALGPPPAITLQSGREGLPPSMAHRSNGASASASIAVPRAKPTNSASAATKTSANKPLRIRCQWVGGSEAEWRALGGWAHKADSARTCRVGSCRPCPSAYAPPAARSAGAASWTKVPQGRSHETWHTCCPSILPQSRSGRLFCASICARARPTAPHHKGLTVGVTAGYDGVAEHGRACTARHNGTATQLRTDAGGIQGYL